MRFGFVPGLFFNAVCIAQGASSFVIHDVRVFDGYSVIEHRDVRIGERHADAASAAGAYGAAYAGSLTRPGEEVLLGQERAGCHRATAPNRTATWAQLVSG